MDKKVMMKELFQAFCGLTPKVCSIQAEKLTKEIVEMHLKGLESSN